MLHPPKEPLTAPRSGQLGLSGLLSGAHTPRASAGLLSGLLLGGDGGQRAAEGGSGREGEEPGTGAPPPLREGELRVLGVGAPVSVWRAAALSIAAATVALAGATYWLNFSGAADGLAGAADYESVGDSGGGSFASGGGISAVAASVIGGSPPVPPGGPGAAAAAGQR